VGGSPFRQRAVPL